MIDTFRGKHTFLSNFYHAPFTDADGRVYPTVENYFQAHKVASPDRDPFTNCSAVEAKRLGRTVAIVGEWDVRRLWVMRQGLARKFREGSELGRRLLDTGDELIVERNTWGDHFWGVTETGGCNWLGHLLMARRAELRGDA